MKFSDYNHTFKILTDLIKTFDIQYLKELFYRSATSELNYNNTSGKFTFKSNNKEKTPLHGNTPFIGQSWTVTSLSSSMGSSSSGNSFYNKTIVEFTETELNSIHVYNNNSELIHSVYFYGDFIIYNDELIDINESMIFQMDSTNDSINLYAINQFKKELDELLHNKNKE